MTGHVGPNYSVQCRIPGKTEWTTEETFERQDAAEAIASRLRKDEPVNDDGETLEYRVLETE